MKIGMNVFFAAIQSPIESPKITDDGYLQTIFYVFFVLVVIIVSIILLIRFLAQKNRGLLSNRSVKTLVGVHLGQNKSLQVVEIGRCLYIIGVGDNVELIEKINQQEEIDFIKQSLRGQGTGSSSERFATIGEWFNRLRREKNSDSEHESTMNFHEVFHHKLQQTSVRRKRIEEIMNEQGEEERLVKK